MWGTGARVASRVGTGETVTCGRAGAHRAPPYRAGNTYGMGGSVGCGGCAVRVLDWWLAAARPPRRDGLGNLGSAWVAARRVPTPKGNQNLAAARARDEAAGAVPHRVRAKLPFSLASRPNVQW